MLYINLLTEDERRLLVDELAQSASDDILLNAVDQAHESRSNMSREMAEFKARRNKRMAIQGGSSLKNVTDDALATEGKLVSTIGTADVEIKLGVATLELKNPITFVEPPGEAAARVTTPTIEAIMRKLQGGPAKLEDINRFISGKMDNTPRVLKLLCSRGKLAYDGQLFYKI